MPTSPAASRSEPAQSGPPAPGSPPAPRRLLSKETSTGRFLRACRARLLAFIRYQPGPRERDW